MAFFSKLFGDANSRYLKNTQPIIDDINKLEPKFERFSDEELRNYSLELKKRIAESGELNAALAEAFALVRESAKRTLNQRHFDVQLIGGVVLHEGKIAEMKTGEGKTLTATLPVYLNALTGKGVHIITVNDYLARRDTAWMGQIYDLLGMTVGCINHDSSYIYDPGLRREPSREGISNSKFLISKQILPPQGISRRETNPNDQIDKLDKERDIQGGFKVVHEFLRPVSRREAYGADITYGTNNEYGFDYLRDNMAYEMPQKVQRGFNFAIVDEVDSILIDEARTPLIISAPDTDSGKLYGEFARIVPRFRENEDYNVDEKLKAVTITEKGIEKVEKTLGIANIYEEGGIRYVHHLEQALKAQVLFSRDRDYVIKNGEVIIVDEFTGRLMPGRRWSEGLHQAVEAKEGVQIQKESRTLATITFQNYFRLYGKLAGMTGTAATSSEEFHKVYNIDVAQIPTNKPMIRTDSPDRIYKAENGKWGALAEEIKKRHEKGQPVLVGTVSIQKNELLSSILNREGIPHQILNAKNHEREAEIIAQAGKPGAVTVATNMAGRGVDIMLGGHAPNKFPPYGGSPEGRQVPSSPPSGDLPKGDKFQVKEGDFNLTEEYKGWQAEYQKVVKAGGLHVIGTERHEARRIDDQLRGRSGRQGDPGSSQFFVSAEDDVIRVFGGDRLKNIMDRLGVGEDEAIENSFVSKAIEQAQSKIEGHYFDMRKHILEYDDVMNRHRSAVYNLRNKILESENCKPIVEEYISDTIGGLVDFHTAGPEWNLEEIRETIKSIINYQLPHLRQGFGGQATTNHEREDKEKLKEEILKSVGEVYDKREKEIGEEQMRRLEKILLLRVIDELWMDHLEAMEYLRDSVRLRAYGQRDPLAEYKIEGQKMFERLMEGLKQQVVSLIFKVGLAQQSATGRPASDVASSLRSKNHSPNNLSVPASRFTGEMGQTETASPSGSTQKAISAPGRKVGRNDPCPCGSGRKYKKCHGT